jgi:putative acetyltransferase
VISIRQETPTDEPGIRAVNERAFERNAEADLIDRLRAESAVVASLVAADGDRVIGHVLFSRVMVGNEAAASLGPMAVSPEYQRQGVGSMLIRAGLRLCRDQGETVVVVLGHPEYYTRFGFSAGAAKRLHAPWSGEAWMALELVSGALTGMSGEVRYARGFEELP